MFCANHFNVFNPPVPLRVPFHLVSAARSFCPRQRTQSQLTGEGNPTNRLGLSLGRLPALQIFKDLPEGHFYFRNLRQVWQYDLAR